MSTEALVYAIIAISLVAFLLGAIMNGCVR